MTKINKFIPIPPRVGKVRVAIRALEIGDSFALPPDYRRSNLWRDAHREGVTVIVRKFGEGAHTHYRAWRTA